MRAHEHSVDFTFDGTPQTQDVPKRIVMPSGVVLDVWKVCDFEADVGWAIGLAHRAPVTVTRHDHRISLTFG